MKKKVFNAKVRLASLALIAAAGAVTAPAFVPGQVMAAESESATVTETEKKTVTRTVRFYFKNDNGSITPVKSSNGGDFVRTSSATFERTVIKDKKTGKIVSAADWGTTELSGFDVPVIEGYTPDRKSIPSVTVSPDKQPEDVKVYYTQNPESKKTLSTEDKEVSRKITYYRINDDGSVSQTWSKTQRVTFTRSVVTDGTGKKEYGAWSSHTFGAEEVAPMPGYTPDISVIPAVTFTPDNPPSDVKVYFRKTNKRDREDVVLDEVLFEVQFTDGQGKVLTTQEVKMGEGAVAPATPTRTGYTFAGWDKDYSNIKGNITVNAKWNKKVTSSTTYENKRVERKIYYYYENGEKVIDTEGKHAVARQWADFTRSIVKSSDGKVTYGDWTPTDFKEMEVMTVKGFIPSISVIPAVKNVTPDNPPSDINVYYSKNGKKSYNINTQSSAEIKCKDTLSFTTSIPSAIWTTSNEKVATVDSNGRVVGIGQGNCVITAVSADGRSKATCKVRVLFKDVDRSEAFFTPIYWAADKGITTGDGVNFAPYGVTTREQVVTFLWRMQGSPAPKSLKSPFKDVTNPSSYSYKAILWAAEKGITTGANGYFAPNATCKRQEFVTFLWRIAGKPNPKSSVSVFKDVKNPSSYSYKAILWAAEKGITTGANGNFAPNGTCKRREAVTFIYRYCRLANKL